MLPAERKRRILAILKERKEVSVQALAEILEEPAANIRRDLRELERESRLIRRHGRALFRPQLLPVPLEAEDDLAPDVLEELVSETAQLLSDARNLFLAGGTVAARVARKLTRKTIATHDLTIAMAAAPGENDVTLVGRELDNRTMTLRSSNLESELADLWFDMVVVETDGLDEKNLWAARQNAAILPAVLERSDSFFAVARSSRVGRKGDRVIGPLNRADAIIIDRVASEEARNELLSSGVDLRVAGAEGEAAFGLDKVGNIFVFKRTGGRFQGSNLAEDLDAHDPGDEP